MTEEFNKSNFIAAFLGIYLFSVAVGAVYHFHVVFEHEAKAKKIEEAHNQRIEALETSVEFFKQQSDRWMETTVEYVEKYDNLLASEPSVIYRTAPRPSYEERQLIKAQTDAQKSMRDYLDAERRRKMLAGVAPTPVPYNLWDKRYEMLPKPIDHNFHPPGCACTTCMMGSARVVHGSACPCSICVNQFNRRID